MKVFVFIATVVTTVSSAYTFLTLGDWGGAALGGQYTKNVYNVAAQLIATAKAVEPKFVINTGDSFYWCGIQNTTDFQIDVDFIQPYNDKSLTQIPWYSILGNHEYGYNVQAHIDYGKINRNWIMDERYFTRRVVVDSASATHLTMIFLDTSPCISSYRSSSNSGWDPCSKTYPTCSLQSTNDDFEGPCMFHENIMSQNCSVQFAWLKKAVAAVPADDWLLIVGHHPSDEINVEDFTTVIQQRGFAMYLNGHTHTLCHYTVDNKGAYVTSGAGSLVNTYDQEHEATKLKAEGKNLEAKGASGSGHSYQTVYNNKVAGFTLHSFSPDFSTLQTDFVTYQGAIVHSFKVNKQGAIVTSEDNTQDTV